MKTRELLLKERKDLVEELKETFDLDRIMPRINEIDNELLKNEKTKMDINMLDYEVIIDRIKNNEYETKIEYPKLTRYRADTIIDEDETVRWNREEVKKRNNARMEALDEYRNSLYEGELAFKEDLASYLVTYNEDTINMEQARVIVKRAWMEGHSDGLKNVLDISDELAELVVEVISLTNPKK